MTHHRNRRTRSAVAAGLLAVLGAAGAFALPQARAASAAQSVWLDGIWRMNGYGTVLTVEHGHLQAYRPTADGCLKGETGERAGRPAADGAVGFETSTQDV